MIGYRPRATGDRVVTIAIEVVTGAEDDARGVEGRARVGGVMSRSAGGRRGRKGRSGKGWTTAISIDGESWERYGRSRDLGDEGLGERSARD